MDTQVTPYLRRRVLALPLEERIALVSLLTDSLRVRERGEELSHLLEKANELAGRDIRERNRTADLVRIRTIFVYVAVRAGFSTMAVGKALKRDHATICYLRDKMEAALSLPEAYGDYINQYEQYIKAI